MLLLTRRRIGESIFIGDQITVTVIDIKGNTVKLSIEAPKNVMIVRSELPEKNHDDDT